MRLYGRTQNAGNFNSWKHEVWVEAEIEDDDADVRPILEALRETAKAEVIAAIRLDAENEWNNYPYPETRRPQARR